MPTVSHRADLCQGPLRRAGSGLIALPVRILRRLARWAEYRRQMRQLAELDERLLDDIGLGGSDGWHITGPHHGPDRNT